MAFPRYRDDDGAPVTSGEQIGHERVYRLEADAMKRAFDLAAATVGLVIAAPILLLLWIGVRLTSTGPGIFAQVRVGRWERPFVCYKLRTMRHGAPNVPTHLVAGSEVTGIGAVLRRSKLDELPQLWNVAKGEMSLVGPRPCLQTQTELIAERRARGVSTLRPGITGLAQVNGIDMSDPRRLAECDAVYLKCRSLGLDIRLILCTLTGRPLELRRETGSS